MNLNPPRLLKNPTDKVIEVTYDGRVTVFKPNETKPVDGNIAAHALEFNNTPLIDVTDELMGPHPTLIVSNPTQEGVDYTLMGLPQLLKLAKSRGIKTKFGMRKNEVITLLLNG